MGVIGITRKYAEDLGGGCSLFRKEVLSFARDDPVKTQNKEAGKLKQNNDVIFAPYTLLILCCGQSIDYRRRRKA